MDLVRADVEARSLRQAMDFFHTWSGVLLGGLLFFIFFMGTIALFRYELDQWMRPELRLALPGNVVPVDTVLARYSGEIAGTDSLYLNPPNPREPFWSLGWESAVTGQYRDLRLDPETGAELPQTATRGGNYFYGLHYSLQLRPIGYWVVAFGGVVMLAALVSGVIVHRRIFADFFTYRGNASTQRMTLDLHNLTSVLLLPFHVVITYSGLVFFYAIYMQGGIHALYDDDGLYFRDLYPRLEREAAGRPVPLASVDQMIKAAQAHWQGGRIHHIAIRNPGDANAVVAIGRLAEDKITFNHAFHSYDVVYFDGVTGALELAPAMTTATRIHGVLTGLHAVQFDRLWLRCAYFLMGLVSCVMIATGSLLWVQKRIRRPGNGSIGLRIVNATGCAGSLGLVCSTAGMLAANRLLPASVQDRPQVEVWIFLGIWLLTLLHALSFPRKKLWWPWRHQLVGVALLCAGAAVANLLTTDWRWTMPDGSWSVAAAVDLILLGSACLAGYAVVRLEPPPLQPVLAETGA